MLCIYQYTRCTYNSNCRTLLIVSCHEYHCAYAVIWYSHHKLELMCRYNSELSRQQGRHVSDTHVQHYRNSSKIQQRRSWKKQAGIQSKRGNGHILGLARSRRSGRDGSALSSPIARYLVVKSIIFTTLLSRVPLLAVFRVDFDLIAALTEPNLRLPRILVKCIYVGGSLTLEA